VGTAILYVLLLMLLGLFTDLMVNRGEIPAFHSVSDADRKAFKDSWQDPLSHFTVKGIDDVVSEHGLSSSDKTRLKTAETGWKEKLKKNGVAEDQIGPRAGQALHFHSLLLDFGLETKEAQAEVDQLCLPNAGKSADAMQWELLWRVGVY